MCLKGHPKLMGCTTPANALDLVFNKATVEIRIKCGFLFQTKREKREEESRNSEKVYNYCLGMGIGSPIDSYAVGDGGYSLEGYWIRNRFLRTDTDPFPDHTIIHGS